MSGVNIACNYPVRVLTFYQNAKVMVMQETWFTGIKSILQGCLGAFERKSRYIWHHNSAEELKNVVLLQKVLL